MEEWPGHPFDLMVEVRSPFSLMMKNLSQWRRERFVQKFQKNVVEKALEIVKGATGSNCSQDRERAGKGWRENH